VPADGPELCEGAACKVVAAGVHAAAGSPGATPQTAADSLCCPHNFAARSERTPLRQHGVLAPNAKLRAQVVPQEPEQLRQSFAEPRFGASFGPAVWVQTNFALHALLMSMCSQVFSRMLSRVWVWCIQGATPSR